MQPDKIRLIIGGYEFTELESMEIVSDLYDPSGSFRFVLGQRVNAYSGARCLVYINGILELTGIIGPVEETMEWGSHTWTVSGKSLISLVERYYVTDWSNPPQTLAQAAWKYLSVIPMVQELPWTIEGKDPAKRHARLDVGDTAFKLLNELAQNRGLLFWAKANGSIVFGKAVGEGEASYHITARNITKRRRVEDTSGLHSEVIIVSDSDDGHRKFTAKNSSVDLKIPFVAAYNGSDSAGMEKQAEAYLRQEKMQCFQLEYDVAGFNLNGKNWAINTLVSVDDDAFDMTDTFLLRTRTFRYDKTTGSKTSLVLCPILAEDVFKAYAKRRKKEDAAW